MSVEGHRCCATSADGKRCRRRAVEAAKVGNPSSGFCEKHSWVAESIREIHQSGIDAERRASSKSDWTEEKP
jgi:hypothetical protein